MNIYEVLLDQGTMNIYEVLLDQGDLSPKSHYILADNFQDAVAQAEKLLKSYKGHWEDSEILRIEKEYKLEVVK